MKTFEEQWDEKFEKFWKPLLMKDGKWDEENIKNELHDLAFVADQIGIIYCELTGNRLSKPMYSARTILSEHEATCHQFCINKDDHEAEVNDHASELITLRTRVEELEKIINNKKSP